MTAPYVVTTTFANQSGNTNASLLDTEFTNIATGFTTVQGTVFGLAGSTLVSGDILYATAASTIARLAKGTNGQILTLASGLPSWASSAAGAVGGVIDGLILSRSAATTIGITAGQCTDSGYAATISLASAYTKTFSAWAVGTGNGGLDTGAIGATTWYHVWAIRRSDTGVSDILISTSATAPTMPANYNQKRRIGSVLTNGSSQLVAFTQDGDYFRWSASVLDVNASNPGTASVTRTLASVPTGINVFAFGDWYNLGGTVGNQNLYVRDLAAADEAPSSSAAPLSIGTANNSINTAGQFLCRTNTSAQIGTRFDASDANTILRIATLGWIDPRGRSTV